MGGDRKTTFVEATSKANGWAGDGIPCKTPGSIWFSMAEVQGCIKKSQPRSVQMCGFATDC